MRTVDRLFMRASVERVFHAASAVERWPEWLRHYRWVRVLARDTGSALVEMAAWRPLGPVKYPTWWVSQMTVDPRRAAIRYRHVRGITTGMDVEWRMAPSGNGTEVSIVHEWSGPRWPLMGTIAANWVIGPVFIHGIASRTLAGIRHAVENGYA
jgi:ribosome-associated toxin RatA of RatAB toxin-antitoxin module